MKFLSRIFQGDKTIWVVTVLLLLISLVSVFSAIGGLAVKNSSSSSFMLLKHSMTIGLGFCACVAAAQLKYKRYAFLLPLLLFLCAPLLIYTAASGLHINGASRQINVIGGFTLQPSDIAKIALVGFVAKKLKVCGDTINETNTFIVKILIPVFVTVGLVFPENFSTAAMLFVVVVMMLFVAKIKTKNILMMLIISMLGGGAYIGYKMMSSSKKEKQEQTAEVRSSTNRTGTWSNRIERYLTNDTEVENPEDDQVIQGKIAVARGGFFGKGPGKSVQRNVLPEAYNDFIFAIILEEYGFFVGIAIMLLYLILFYRTLVIIKKMPSSFGGFLAVGLVLNIMIQAFANIGVVTGLFPVTGQPLPLISKGGSSIFFTCIAIGIIISISKETYNQDERQTELATQENSD